MGCGPGGSVLRFGPAVRPDAFALRGSAPIHPRPQPRCATTALAGGPAELPPSLLLPFHFISLETLAPYLDRLFGTCCRPEGDPAEIGVDEPHPRGYLRLLLWPFLPKRRS